MKYVVRIFTPDNGSEKFLKAYEFDSLPYIPRQKECLIFNDVPYKVMNVCSSYEYKEDLDNYNNEIWFEIMIKEVDENKEWWE